MSDLKAIFEKISMERQRQDAKHGEKNSRLDGFSIEYIAYIAEELGEASQILQYITDEQYPERLRDNTLIEHYRSELTQVAALAVQVMEKLPTREQTQAL